MRSPPPDRLTETERPQGSEIEGSPADRIEATDKCVLLSDSASRDIDEPQFGDRLPTTSRLIRTTATTSQPVSRPFVPTSVRQPPSSSFIFVLLFSSQQQLAIMLLIVIVIAATTHAQMSHSDSTPR
jgi:hypothetical protein